MLITKTEDLRSFCASLSGAPYVTVDTEFMRERTYYAKLCLVQLGGPEDAVVVDPLSHEIDLQPLFELMADPSIVKVFHAARQDVEIFVNLTGVVPAPMFDTQVAGMVCGFGDAASYETLASRLANARVDKSNRFTDWAQRPLTDKQVDYALGDVTHLRIVYEKLKDMLEKSGRADWVQEEMAILRDVKTYRTEPDEAWRRLKLRTDKPRVRAVLRAVAGWREREAQRLNVPRGRVMKDEVVLELAYHAPKSGEDMDRARGVSQGFSKSRQGEELLALIAAALSLRPDQCPEVEERTRSSNGSGATLDLLKVLLKQVGEEHGVAPKLIATTDDLEELAGNPRADINLLKGWRRQIFGDHALALMRGELALRLEKGRVIVGSARG
jgi:ribonuclease D